MRIQRRDVNKKQHKEQDDLAPTRETISFTLEFNNQRKATTNLLQKSVCSLLFLFPVNKGN